MPIGQGCQKLAREIVHFCHKFEAKIQAVQVIVVGMDVIPGFGDSVGLRRLYKTAVERIRQEDLPEADKRAWIAELTRQYPAATADGIGSAPAARESDEGFQ